MGCSLKHSAKSANVLRFPGFIRRCVSFSEALLAYGDLISDLLDNSTSKSLKNNYRQDNKAMNAITIPIHKICTIQTAVSIKTAFPDIKNTTSHSECK